MIPSKRLVLKEYQSKNNENNECDHLLNHFQLQKSKGSTMIFKTYSIRGDLKTIFEKGDSPTDQNKNEQTPSCDFFIFGESQMAIPGNCHKDIR